MSTVSSAAAVSAILESFSLSSACRTLPVSAGWSCVALRKASKMRVAACHHHRPRNPATDQRGNCDRHAGVAERDVGKAGNALLAHLVGEVAPGKQQRQHHEVEDDEPGAPRMAPEIEQGASHCSLRSCDGSGSRPKVQATVSRPSSFSTSTSASWCMDPMRSAITMALLTAELRAGCSAIGAPSSATIHCEWRGNTL